MAGKIVLLLIMIIGAVFVYGAKTIVSKIEFLDNDENNVLKIKITGFIIILISAIIAFSIF